MPTLPAGAWPVMITPFTTNLDIDWSAYRTLIDFYLQEGSAGLFAACLSSEIQHLSHDEIVELARLAVQHVDGRVPVVASAAIDASVETIAQLVGRLAETGVDAVVLAAGTLTPADADESRWRDAFTQVMNANPDIPLGIYECPWPNHRKLSADTMGWLAQTGRVVFHKDTSCDAGVIRAKLEAIADSPLAFYNAHQPTLAESIRLGGSGYSGVGANFVPEAYVDVCDTLQDDASRSDAAWRVLSELDAVIPSGYPANAKAFLALRGLPIGTACRVAPDGEIDHDALRAFHATVNEWLVQRSVNCRAKSVVSLD